MDEEDQLICELSDLIAKEIEVETSMDADELKKLKSTPKKIEPFFEPADYSNGALYEELNYCWSQTFTEVGQFRSSPKLV